LFGSSFLHLGFDFKDEFFRGQLESCPACFAGFAGFAH